MGKALSGGWLTGLYGTEAEEEFGFNSSPSPTRRSCSLRFSAHSGRNGLADARAGRTGVGDGSGEAAPINKCCGLVVCGSGRSAQHKLFLGGQRGDWASSKN